MASIEQLKTAGVVEDLEGWECALSSSSSFSVSYPDCSFSPGDCVSRVIFHTHTHTHTRWPTGLYEVDGYIDCIH